MVHRRGSTALPGAPRRFVVAAGIGAERTGAREREPVAEAAALPAA
jgi:hypothetical protein